MWHRSVRHLGTSSVSPEEISRFANASKQWWNPNGQYQVLHRMNPVRMGYINKQCSELLAPLDGLKVLDIGCGGGLLSESLARVGANVVGADATLESIGIAEQHKNQDHLLSSLEYRHTTAEDMASTSEKFDVLCGLEIIEHVADRKVFLQSCSDLVKPGGLLFFSTINRTPLASLLTIFMAERVLGYAPEGTHDYAKYVTPQEFENELDAVSCKVVNMRGMGYNPFTKKWSLLEDGFGDLLMNYILVARKPASTISSTFAQAGFSPDLGIIVS